MLQRVLIIAALMALLALALQSIPGPDAYFSMQIQQVGGRPYLLLQHSNSSMEPGRPYFSIYTPRDKNLDDWVPVTADRLGPAYGMFTAKTGAAPERDEKPSASEQLGLFHEGRVTYFDVATTPITTTLNTLPFKWTAETAAQLKGVTYAFGVEQPSTADESLQREESVKGTLRVARLVGQTWEDLKLDGPPVEFKSPGFVLQSVGLNDDIKVFWRQMVADQVIDSAIEGPRAAGQGPLFMTTFSGQAFSDRVVSVSGIPRGNFTSWSEDDRVGLLVQTSARPGEKAQHRAPMELRVLIPQADGKSLEAQLVETIDSDKAPPGLLNFIAAEYLQWQGQEFILRTNWQMFEVWHKTADQRWALVMRNPKGLPTYNLEAFLLSLLLLTLSLIAFGVGLAYRRRKLNWSAARKIQARDVYASIGVRMGAYAVDLLLIFTVLIVGSQHLGWGHLALQDMLDFDITRLPYVPFFVLYLAYLVTSEWLCGATVGKYIMGLRVVSDAGQKLTLWAALVRNLVGFYERLPQAAIFVPLPMIIFTPRRQRLGDLLSRTYVVHKAAMEAYNAQRAQELAARDDASGDPLRFGAEQTAGAKAGADADSKLPSPERKDEGPSS